MAAAATAVKLHMRVSRWQEAGVVLQERAWVQEAAGDLVKKGQSLINFVATNTSFSHCPSLGAAVLGSPGLHLPSWSLTKSTGGIIPNSPVEPLAGNLSASRDHISSSKVKVQFEREEATLTPASNDGLGFAFSVRNVGSAKTDSRRPPHVQSTEEEDYGWENDPNGGWLASLP